MTTWLMVFLISRTPQCKWTIWSKLTRGLFSFEGVVHSTQDEIFLLSETNNTDVLRARIKRTGSRDMRAEGELSFVIFLSNLLNRLYPKDRGRQSLQSILRSSKRTTRTSHTLPETNLTTTWKQITKTEGLQLDVVLWWKEKSDAIGGDVNCLSSRLPQSQSCTYMILRIGTGEERSVLLCCAISGFTSILHK